MDKEKQRVAKPEPGEIWNHQYYGRVRIIRKWNDRESVCEEIDSKRRRLLANELIRQSEPPREAKEDGNL